MTHANAERFALRLGLIPPRAVRAAKMKQKAQAVLDRLDVKLELDLPHCAAVRQSVCLIIVEGNYLLLDREPRNKLAACFDLTVIIDVPQDVLRQRLRHHLLTRVTQYI